MLPREAALADVPSIADAWYAMLDESGLLHVPVDPDWRDPLIAQFSRALSVGRQRWFVVEVAGHIAATGGLFLRPGGAGAALTGKSCTIAGVYTYPAHRRNGYARAILEQLIDCANREGCDILRLRATPLGRPLYESLGFLPGDEMYLRLYR